MPEIKIYSSAKEMPAPLYYQAETFVRLTWADDRDYDMDVGFYEPAVNVTLAQEETNTLFSYAPIIELDLNFEGTDYRCYGLRSVFTFPASRRRGYGGQVVQASTEFIQGQEDEDIALLWTEAKNVDFYARYGWITMPELTILEGDPESPQVNDEEMPMMLFTSKSGRSAKQAISSGQLYIGDEPW